MRKQRAVCKIADCGRPAVGKRLCHAHYKRFRRTGDAGGLIAPKAGRGEALAFFCQSLTYAGEDCLLWPYKRGNNGYALLNASGASPLVHRRVCEAHNGPPPSPLHQAAHACGNGHLGCISRWHLSWKTPAENCADRVTHAENKLAGRQ